MKGQRHYVQGYNTQTVVTEDQIVLAAEITIEAGDFSHLRPMLTATVHELTNAGIEETPHVAIADAGYWKRAAHGRRHRRARDRGADPPGLRET